MTEPCIDMHRQLEAFEAALADQRQCRVGAHMQIGHAEFILVEFQIEHRFAGRLGQVGGQTRHSG